MVSLFEFATPITHQTFTSVLQSVILGKLRFKVFMHALSLLFEIRLDVKLRRDCKLVHILELYLVKGKDRHLLLVRRQIEMGIGVGLLEVAAVVHLIAEHGLRYLSIVYPRRLLHVDVT